MYVGNDSSDMSLPIYKTDSKDLSLLQTTWAKQIDPVINFPPNKGIILKNVLLTTGSNVVNHQLGRKLQGWVIVRQRALASIYDTQDLNQMPDLTLLLTSSTNVNIDLLVF